MLVASLLRGPRKLSYPLFTAISERKSILEVTFELTRHTTELRTTVIESNLPPAEHTLKCELLRTSTDPDGGHEFRIIAVDGA